MANAGVPGPVLQKIAAHSSYSTAAKYYIHIQPEDHREAVAVLDSPATISGSGKNANGTRMENERGQADAT